MSTPRSAPSRRRGTIEPNAKHCYEVTRADLPLHCPLDGMSLWNSHPRVYLPIEETGRDAYLRQLEFASVELSLDHLMMFPWVRSMVEDDRLHLHGAYFGVATGELFVRDPATKRFLPWPDRKSEKGSAARF